MRNNSLPFAFFEGKIFPVEQAKVSIMTSSLQYGITVLEGIPSYISADKKYITIFKLPDYYKSFLNSLKIINQFIKYDIRTLEKITFSLLKKNQPKTNCYFRLLAYAKNYKIGANLNKLDYDFALYMIPLDEYITRKKGLKITISNWIKIDDNVIPSHAQIAGSYMNSSLAKAEAIRLGFDDALMLTQNGHLTHGVFNFFIVSDRTLITPPGYVDTFDGIFNKTIIELAIDLGIPVQEKNIDRTEVYIADEAFITGIGSHLVWIIEVDGRKIGNGIIGPITAQIRKLFLNIVKGKENRYSKWLTKVNLN